MPRNITITFSDNSAHRYENIPDSVTPDMIESRVQKDFPGKKISNIDGGKNTAAPASTDLSKDAKNILYLRYSGYPRDMMEDMYNKKGQLTPEISKMIQAVFRAPIRRPQDILDYYTVDELSNIGKNK